MSFFSENVIPTRIESPGVFAMKEIKLTQGQVALVSDEDFERLNQHKWYASRQGEQKKFYAVRCVDHRYKGGKYQKIWLHREVVSCPSEFVVDHIDGNGLNCMRHNLEIVTAFENLSRAGKKAQQNRIKKVNDEIYGYFGEVTI